MTLYHPVLGVCGDVHDFKLSPNSSRVVYLADQKTDEVVELFVADSSARDVAFSSIAQRAAEGAGSVTLTVRLNQSSVDTISVAYSATGGDAINSEDYVLPPGSVTFAPG